MYFAELLYVFVFSPSNEKKPSVAQLPHNSIISPSTQLIFQIPGEKKKRETENSSFEITSMWKT